MITSNHIHLLVVDDGPRDTISKSMQLIAGRIGQEYNRRKKRKGAFWEDRYNATAIEGDDHLFRCMVYIDMNMVRTGTVSHPLEWAFCGYHEINHPKKGYAIINYGKLAELSNSRSISDFRVTYNRWMKGALSAEHRSHQSKWTESVAVGGKEFVERTKERLAYRAKGRKVIKMDEDYQLREQQEPYSANLGHKKVPLNGDNSYYWNVSLLK